MIGVFKGDSMSLSSDSWTAGQSALALRSLRIRGIVWVIPQRGAILGSNYQDYSILESILGSPYFWETTI